MNRPRHPVLARSRHRSRDHPRPRRKRLIAPDEPAPPPNSSTTCYSRRSVSSSTRLAEPKALEATLARFVAADDGGFRAAALLRARHAHSRAGVTRRAVAGPASAPRRIRFCPAAIARARAPTPGTAGVPASRESLGNQGSQGSRGVRTSAAKEFLGPRPNAIERGEHALKHLAERFARASGNERRLPAIALAYRVLDMNSDRAVAVVPGSICNIAVVLIDYFGVDEVTEFLINEHVDLTLPAHFHPQPNKPSSRRGQLPAGS